jgi:hypothetical protein
MLFMLTQTLISTVLCALNISFEPLFNGENLDGWTIVNGDKTTWVAKDNMIVTTGKPTGVIRTEKMYENFILELDWRHIVENGNAGLFVWSDALPSVGVPFTRAIEVQIMDGRELDWYTTHGDIFSIWGAKMTPDRPHPNGYERCLPSERRSKPSPEWNHYKVTCIDGVIKLEVNGKEVSGGFDISPRKGYICLEAEGTEAHFKNITIKELPPATTPLKPEMVAENAKGFTSIFTGINLLGWDLVGSRGWVAKGNVLNCNDQSKTLKTIKPQSAFELQIDYRCNSQESSAYVVIDNEEIKLPCNEVGKWARFNIKGDGGTIGIGGKNASFTNLFIRPLN